MIYISENPVKVGAYWQIIHAVNTKWAVDDAFHGKNYQQSFL